MRKEKREAPAFETIKLPKRKLFTKIPIPFTINYTILFPHVVRGGQFPAKNEQPNATSAAVESRPKENRTSEFASPDCPRATITCEGSSEPAEQAEPLEAQIPSRSSPASKRNAVRAANHKRNGVGQPKSARTDQFRAFNVFDRVPSIGLPAEPVQTGSKTGGLTNLSIASAKPMMPARFSVPARRSFSWPPPKKSGRDASGDRMKSNPAPFGP